LDLNAGFAKYNMDAAFNAMLLSSVKNVFILSMLSAGKTMYSTITIYAY